MTSKTSSLTGDTLRPDFSSVFWILALSAIALFGYLLPAIGYFQMIPGDLGDARFNSVILEHGYQWLTGQADRLWSPGFFYPFERVLGFSDNHFATFWVYVAARAFGAVREDGFLFWFLVGNTLNFFSCLWVLRRFGFRAIAASCGAFVFAFSLPVLHQEGHAQLVYRFAIPLAVWAWWEVLEHRRLLGIFITAFWVAIQFLCSIYLGVFLGYLLAAMSLSYLVLNNASCLLGRFGAPKPESLSADPARPGSTWMSKRGRVVWIVAAVVALVLVAWMMKYYQAVSADYRLSRPLEALEPLIPKLSSYLLADRSGLSSWLGSGVADFPMRPEHQMFVGLGVLVLAFLGVGALIFSKGIAAKFGKLGRMSVASIVVLMGMTVVVGGYSFYFLVIQIPGLDAIRAVSLVILVMLLPVGVLVAVGVEWLIGMSRSWGMRGAVAILVVSGLTAETISYQSHQAAKETWEMRQRRLSHAVGESLPAGSVLYVTQRMEEPFYITEIDAMIYAQDNYLKTLNGYSGSTPPGYKYPESCVDVASRLEGYFNFRNVSAEDRERLIKQVRLVQLQPCVKGAR
jgi:hypothetical protein